jgi:hypothetical protein
MAAKQYYVDQDGLKVNILKDWRLNPLTTAARTTLAGTLNSTHEGLPVFDTDLNQIFYWDGAAFVSGVAPITGAMVYKGAYSNLTTVPSSAADGDTYVMTAAGTLTWAGITFNPSANVTNGDVVIRRDATTWDVIEGNNVAASETVAGNIEIATQTETNTATDDLRAITPLKLEQRFVNRGTPRSFLQSAITLVANTAFTINFPTNASNLAAFSVSVKDSAGSEIGVDVDAVSVSGFTITSSIAATNITAFVTYF